MRNIILGVTGSVAAIKSQKLYESLSNIGNVVVVATKAGSHFLKQSNFPYKYLTDEDEWNDVYKLGDSILHIELRKEASALVLAPLDANTLAKISLGLCDNLLTSVVRAWDWSKPMVLAPSMNTMMWENEPTFEQLKVMKNRGAIVVNPVEKVLACGDLGMGAMADTSEISNILNGLVRWKFPLNECPGIPINHHPGAFGFHRKKNHHTGVDLYCKNDAKVHAVEDGVIVHVDQFTGAALGHTWWNDTWGVMVEGSSGVVNYGELNIPKKQIGDRVKRGDLIGNVKQVLFDDRLRPDIDGHSCSMLHLELYKHGTRSFADWHDPQKNPSLLDPTPYLMTSENCPLRTLTWANSESKTVG